MRSLHPLHPAPMKLIQQLLPKSPLCTTFRTNPIHHQSLRPLRLLFGDARFCTRDNGAGVVVGDLEVGRVPVRFHPCLLTGFAPGEVFWGGWAGPDHVAEGFVRVEGGELADGEGVEVGGVGDGELEGHGGMYEDVVVW
ncbi:hypothetical protein MMC26_001250 [Xylographa opegraphella]|nr:hypothetical protein [Xylographa opegraphella]